MRPFFIIILGPTGVGKTDFSLDLARAISGEIINADMGQFYTELSIGTAKPDWRSYDVQHHLFDSLDTPEDYAAFTFRNDCKEVLHSIAARNHIPIFVGGSGFYGKSLLYSVTSPSVVSPSREPYLDTSDSVPSGLRRTLGMTGNELSAGNQIPETGQSLWDQLHAIDPQRAAKIHPHDTYRLERALDIWRATGALPSSFEPVFDPLGDCLVLFLDRDPEDLKRRIAQRAGLMMEQGWLDEVKKLSPAWRSFASTKLIGYREVAALADMPDMSQEAMDEAIASAVEAIVARTHTYSRRQRIFWRSLKKELAHKGVWFEDCNLTLLGHTLYINQLLEKLQTRIMSGAHAQ